MEMMKLRSRERILFLGFISYMATLATMAYLMSQAPPQNHIILGSSSSSGSISKVREAQKHIENVSIEKMAVLRMLKLEVKEETKGKDSVETYQYVLGILRDFKKKQEETDLKMNITRLHPEEDSDSEPVKNLPENNRERTINIQVHDIQLRQFQIKVPYPLNESRRDRDLTRLEKIMVSLGKRRKIWKKGARQHTNIYAKTSTNWELFHNQISQYDLYPPDSPLVEKLLHDLSNLTIIHSEQKSGGTQIKLTMTLTDEGDALFKPMRWSRESETLPNHFYFSDYERHSAEIAAFHLDRLLGFRRAPPVAGRYVNLTGDVLEFADRSTAKTFFVSPAGNLCFHGKCSYYCDSGHAICGNPTMIEGSMAAMLPSSKVVYRKAVRHPWRRAYHKRKRAVWEEDNDYCDVVRQTEPYNKGRRLLDIMDLAVYDFLMGNQDRHHYELLEHFGNESYFIHLDHGRAFGQPRYDDLSALAPIYQCCLMRHSTLETLFNYHKGALSLGAALKESLKKDVLFPLLAEAHYEAIDRRIKIILQLVYQCIISRNTYHSVIKDDGY